MLRLSGGAAGALLFIACSNPPESEPDGSGGAQVSVDAGAGAPNVLVFSRTSGFRHESIPEALAALVDLAGARGWGLTASEDAGLFADEFLSGFDAVVFLLTTGDVLDTGQQGAFERYVQSGKGYVGVHSASDTEYEWPWYGELVGAYFKAHPPVQQASLIVEPGHPGTDGLPTPWSRHDEWYGFADNPRGTVTVLLRLDESSYDAGEGAMGADHPIAWYREYDGGRSFYTALGHTRESYVEPAFLSHLASGIEWAASGR